MEKKTKHNQKTTAKTSAVGEEKLTPVLSLEESPWELFNKHRETVRAIQRRLVDLEAEETRLREQLRHYHGLTEGYRLMIRELSVS